MRRWSSEAGVNHRTAVRGEPRGWPGEVILSSDLLGTANRRNLSASHRLQSRARMRG
ncbi:hypothetical protein ACVIHD_006008 [Bradyrhizobium embrapense]